MAKKWIDANFKSRGEAIEYCADVGRLKNEDGLVVFCDNNGDVRIYLNRRHVGLRDEFWDSYATMKIEVDEPEYEIGKYYFFHDYPDPVRSIVRRLRCISEDGMYIDSSGAGWMRCSEIPSELIGKIK